MTTATANKHVLLKDGTRYVFTVKVNGVQVEKWLPKALAFRYVLSVEAARLMYASLKACGYRAW